MTQFDMKRYMVSSKMTAPGDTGAPAPPRSSKVVSCLKSRKSDIASIVSSKTCLEFVVSCFVVFPCVSFGFCVSSCLLFFFPMFFFLSDVCKKETFGNTEECEFCELEFHFEIHLYPCINRKKNALVLSLAVKHAYSASKFTKMICSRWHRSQSEKEKCPPATHSIKPFRPVAVLVPELC